MADERIRLDDRAVHSLLKSPSGPLASDLLGRANAVAAAARRLVHKETERLEESIKTRVVLVKGIVHADVYSDNEHAFWQEFDAPPQGKSFLRAGLSAATGKRGQLISPARARRGRRIKRYTKAERRRQSERRQARRWVT